MVNKRIKRTLCALVAAATIGLGLVGCGSGESISQESPYQFEKHQTPITQVTTRAYSGSAFSAVDYDKDGDLDLLVADTSDGKVYLHLNENGHFYQSKEPIAEILTRARTGSAFSAVDYDEDGDIDLLVADTSDGNVYLYENISE